MDEWTKQRTCELCGSTFSLSAHGHAGAQAAAQSLEQGALDPGSLPHVVTKCPTCLVGGKMSEQEAILATMRMQHEMDKSTNTERYRIGRLIGAVVTVFSILGLFMVRYYIRLRRGEYAMGTVWTVVMIVFLVAGIVTFLWGYSKSSKRRSGW
jgi:hypothetical protein